MGVQLSYMKMGLSLIEHDWKHIYPLFIEISKYNLPPVYELARLACEGEGTLICYGLAALNALTIDLYFNSGKYQILEDMDVIELWKD